MASGSGTNDERRGHGVHVPVGHPLHGSFDHLILATADVERTARSLREAFGLESVVGGTHPSGTANWIVPLEPPCYLELLFVEDRVTLLADPWGRDFARRVDGGDFWLGWALRTADIEAAGAALGAGLEPGEARRADGSSSRWTTAELADDRAGALPFFIRYDDAAEHRQARFEQQAAEAGHERTPGPVSWIEVAADEAIAVRLADLGVDVEIRLTGDLGDRGPGIRAVGLTLDGAVVGVRPEALGA